MRESSYSDVATAGSGARSVKWNGANLVLRQLILIVSSILLARILGVQAYGIVAQATVFTTLTMLLLDQGLTAALVQRRSVGHLLAGAASTINIALGLVLGGITVAGASAAGLFFGSPDLPSVLMVLGVGLLLKAVVIVPRMLLTRSLQFRVIAIADVSGAFVGAACGIVAGLNGMGYWAIVIQICVTDLFVAMIMISAARPPLPNRHIMLLREVVGFSSRVFVSDLFSFSSRNGDNILIAKFLGATQLGFYALSYRVLLTPIQLVTQTVTKVMFPAISKLRHTGGDVPGLVVRALRAVAAISFPFMAYVGVSAAQSVPLVLGEGWQPAVAPLMILAVTGARQSVTSLNAPVLMGLGRADVLMRFSIVSSVLQVLSFVIGVPFGIVGVALSYTVVGILLTIPIVIIQKRIGEVSYRSQFGAIAGPLHGSMWVVAGYLALAFTGLDGVLLLGVGLVMAVLVYISVLVIFHRKSLRSLLLDAKLVVAR